MNSEIISIINYLVILYLVAFQEAVDKGRHVRQETTSGQDLTPHEINYILTQYLRVILIFKVMAKVTLTLFRYESKEVVVMNHGRASYGSFINIP
jgi:hypothetical protein